MAPRKTGPQRTGRSGRKSPVKTKRAPFAAIFWMVIIIFLISIFFILLLPMAKKGISIPRPKLTEQPAPQEPDDQKPVIIEPVAPKPNAQPEKPPEKPPAPVVKDTPPEKPPAPVVKDTLPEKPPTPVVKDTPPEKPPAPAPPQPKPPQPVQPPPVSQPERKPVETRDRTIYFMQERNDGADLRLTQVSRKIAVSNSPLLDCINALLAGPSAEESKRGLVSCIPDNSRLISAEVVNNTAILNFNEEFRYNVYGREDSAAQLKQIVWTATEFSNIHNVQIKINGKIVDFLVEGVSIKNPIGRN